MNIILLDNVKNVGKFGDTVTVRDGYARNWLLPKGKALPATERNQKKFDADKLELQAVLNASLTSLQSRADEIAAITLEFVMKSSDEGKLYGSISTSDIAKAFKAKGVEVRRQDILLPAGPIRELGDFEIDINLHSEIKCAIKVTVIADK